MQTTTNHTNHAAAFVPTEDNLRELAKAYATKVRIIDYCTEYPRAELNRIREVMGDQFVAEAERDASAEVERQLEQAERWASMEFERQLETEGRRN